MKRYNKATAAVLSGAIVTVIGSAMVLDQELSQALQTLITAALVWLVPND